MITLKPLTVANPQPIIIMDDDDDCHEQCKCIAHIFFIHGIKIYLLMYALMYDV